MTWVMGLPPTKLAGDKRNEVVEQVNINLARLCSTSHILFKSVGVWYPGLFRDDVHFNRSHGMVWYGNKQVRPSEQGVSARRGKNKMHRRVRRLEHPY